MAEIKINRERCKGCLLCVTVCPKKKIDVSKKSNAMGLFPVEFSDDSKECTGCAFCALVCPDCAIEVFK